jgi:MYXO-CTERM domain-containing protein
MNSATSFEIAAPPENAYFRRPPKRPRTAPKLVKADDMSPEVWLIDSGYRRHVPNPDVLVAWEFDGATVELMPAAEINALPKGPDVRNAPYLVKGSGAEVYLIDDAFEGTIPNTKADAGPEDDAAVNPAADPNAAELNGSCGCRAAPSRTNGGFAAVGLALLISRRRRSPRRTAR